MGESKDQLISKSIYGLLTSPKERTDEFVLFAFLLFTANKSNSSVRFLGESTACQSAFRFYLTFRELLGESQPIWLSMSCCDYCSNNGYLSDKGQLIFSRISATPSKKWLNQKLYYTNYVKYLLISILKCLLVFDLSL